MRRTSTFPTIKPLNLLLIALVFIIAGCSFQKKSGFNRDMQNLTAHYNILFNANEILRLKQISYATSFVDNYNEVLSVYQDTTAQTTTPDKDLDAATIKANSIINLKEQSHYLGDAYLVLGKANYLEANFYNAVEYFNYVIRVYPKNKDLWQQAHEWKARTLIYLDKLPEAKLTIDTAIDSIKPKKRVLADLYATKLEYDIDVQDYADGEDMGKKAVFYCRDNTQRLRWTFILAQVEELNNKPLEALENYRQIAKSNALFEMAFNASLNVIRIEENANGIKLDRKKLLLALLKNPNNSDFKDQIYYQVGQMDLTEKSIDDAIKYYNLSVRATVKNQSQKGLSYLRLAEIYFNNKADYVRSKKYYDSTLTSLPTNFPGYLAIQKKSANLALLADRLQIITHEDTIQALAKMDEKTRATVIDKMVTDYVAQQQALANAAKGSATTTTSSGPGSGFSGGSFYFDNAGAVSQGYTDFKKVWGTRKLEDNWRISSRGNANDQGNSTLATQGIDPDAPPGAKGTSTKSNSGAASYRASLVQSLPLTPELMAQSNQRLYNAYVDVADFYRDILDEKKQSIFYFETILGRFPNDPNKPAIYYSLFRLYSEIDPAKSEFYKNKLLKEFPDTPFAKIITDPNFIKELEDKDAAFTNAYNKVFDLYAQKKYKDVISTVPDLMKQYPDNKLASQLYYLQTISQGHFEALGPFKDSLQHLVKTYPMDRLITPLAKQHLTYIDANTAELQARTVVLADVNPQDIPFTLARENQKLTPYEKKVAPWTPELQAQAVKTAVKKPPVVTPPTPPPTPKPATTVAATVATNKPAIAQPVTAAATPATPPPAIATTAVNTPPSPTATALAVPPPVAPPTNVPASTPPATTTPNVPATTPPVTTPTPVAATTAAVTPPIRSDSSITVSAADPDLKTKAVVASIFSKLDSTNYYFAINVTSGTTNVASSRFGIGQFTRANYAGSGIRHNLMAVGDSDQVIYVGKFSSLESVKKYARSIVPLLPDIMKVPAGKYGFFIITKENLDKLADKKTLDSYIDYYQNNY